jgi:hypothetical protein
MPTTEATLRRHLKALTGAVQHSIKALDDVMQSPENHERGKKVARITNFLELENDKARHFGLGISLRRKK